MNQNNVKRATTATAKPKGARVRATKNKIGHQDGFIIMGGNRIPEEKKFAGFDTMPKSFKCGCACHGTNRVGGYGHDSVCCAAMNGFLEVRIHGDRLILKPLRMELEKSPIGWHFIGHREQPIYSFEEMSAEAEYWMWRSEKYRIAFYIAMVGLLIIGAMNIFK